MLSDVPGERVVEFRMAHRPDRRAEPPLHRYTAGGRVGTPATTSAWRLELTDITGQGQTIRISSMTVFPMDPTALHVVEQKRAVRIDPDAPPGP